MDIRNGFSDMTTQLDTCRYTLEELLQLCEENAAASRELYSKDRVTTDKARVACESLSIDDFHSKSTAYNAYVELEKDARVCRSQIVHRQIINTGLQGAIRYYMALRYNEIIPGIRDEFSDKRMGPKTWDKFITRIIQEMNVLGLHCLFTHGRIEFYGGGVKDCYLWLLDGNITDDDNHLASNLLVQVPCDNFHGEYPSDWADWARLVQAANEQIKEEYERFCATQDALVNALKIGDVPMNRVYSYEMKERA